MFAKVNIRESFLDNIFFLYEEDSSDFSMSIGRFKNMQAAKIGGALFRRVSAIRKNSIKAGASKKSPKASTRGRQLEVHEKPSGMGIIEEEGMSE